nr:putative late blight resistance protein homolog R1A-4 [Ipomoea batatas]
MTGIRKSEIRNWKASRACEGALLLACCPARWPMLRSPSASSRLTGRCSALRRLPRGSLDDAPLSVGFLAARRSNSRNGDRDRSEMAYAALTSLIATLNLEGGGAANQFLVDSLSETLDSLILENWKISDGVSAAAIKDLETKIRDFALQLEDDFEIQKGNYTEVSNILQQAITDANELLSFIKKNIYRSVDTEYQPALSINPRIKYASGSSKTKRVFEDQYKMVGREHDFGVIKDQILENNARSIFFFHEDPEMFISFKLLRVLAFVPSSFLQRMSMHLSDLVCLRYLSVTQWFEGMDCIVSRNWNLQTLVVSGNESQFGAPTIHLPCEIWDLPYLRHLELGNMYSLDPPFQIEDKENLQTLSWASPTLYQEDAYFNFSNLRKLKVFYRGGSCSNNPLILDSIDYLEKLEKLTISALVGCTITLPEQCMFPLQLKKLGLSGTNLCSWDLSVISMLPQLEVLKLKNAIHGNIWEVDKGGFNKLRFLLIEDRNLKQLRTYLSCFKCLERLVLRSCCCLEEIPWFLAFHVQSIELEGCHPSAIEAAMQIRDAGQKILKRRIEVRAN